MGGEVPEQLEKLVSQGRMGKKSNHGYYQYNNGKRELRKSEPFAGSLLDIQDRLILRYLNEAVACLREGIIDTEDNLDAGMIFGTGFALFVAVPCIMCIA